ERRRRRERGVAEPPAETGELLAARLPRLGARRRLLDAVEVLDPVAHVAIEDGAVDEDRRGVGERRPARPGLERGELGPLEAPVARDAVEAVPRRRARRALAGVEELVEEERHERDRDDDER